jgi:SAM-dependent methyltransferase
MSTPHVSTIALWKEGVRQEWTAAAAGWRKWHAQTERLSRAATEAIMQAGQVTLGMHVLDLASGTGDPALALARAVGPEGAVTATDLVPEMLAAAADHARQRHVTNLTFQQADPETLPFPAQSFDVVTCRMGVMLFANVAQALREIHRVLKPEGRVAFIAQGPVDQNPWQASIMRVLRKYVPVPPPRLVRRTPIGLPSRVRSRRCSATRASGTCTKSRRWCPGPGPGLLSSTGRIDAKRGHVSVSPWSPCPRPYKRP